MSEGRVVLLTGAAGGLGTVMTAALLEAGHKVAALDRDAAALDRLADRLKAQRENMLLIGADVSIEDECNAAVDETVAHFGRIDGLVNNAGIGMSSIRPDAETKHPGIEELSTEIWDRFYAVNVRGPMMLTRAAAPHMRKAKWGRIVNNTTSYKTMLRVLPYGATKSALRSMSAVWAQQLTGSGVTVNVPDPRRPDRYAVHLRRRWLAARQMLRPAIMAQPICWLMSDEADGVTGRRITASGWNTALRASDAAAQAGRGIGWPELAAGPAWW